MQSPGIRWPLFRIKSFGEERFDVFDGLRCEAFAHKHAAHFRCAVSQTGALLFVLMNGPKCSAASSSHRLLSHFLSRISICTQLSEAWDNFWCQRRSSFWEPDRFVLSAPRIDLILLMACKLVSEYPKASSQNEKCSWCGKASESKGRLLWGQSAADIWKPLSNKKSIPCACWKAWPPTVCRRT